MNNEFLEGVFYDWHNDNILGRQNRDIKFYKNYIKKHNIDNVLVVGAGTGRVAIPLSKIAKVDALDLSLGRLIRLSEHDDSINIIATDFLKYETIVKYSLIIFPYSTIQAFALSKYEQIINKIKKLLNSDGICLIDYDRSFENMKNTKKKKKCESYCKRIREKVVEYDTEYIRKGFIEVCREFYYNDTKKEVKEKWYLFNFDLFQNKIEDNNMVISNIFDGYNNNSSYKRVIEIKGLKKR